MGTPEQNQESEHADKPPCYFESPNLVFRGSALSLCPVRLANIAMGRIETHSDSTKQNFALGHVFEEIVVAKLANPEPNHPDPKQCSRPIIIQNRQKKIEYQIAPNLLIRGHIDGMIHNADILPEQGGLWLLAEIKSASPSSFKTFSTYGIDKYPGYKKQLQIYCSALDLTGAFIFFINKETHEMCTRFFDARSIHSPNILAEIKDTCVRTLTEISNITQKKPSKCNEFKTQMFECTMPDLHETDLDAVTISDNLPLEVMIDDYFVIDAKIAELEQQKKVIRSIMEEQIFKNKASRVYCGVAFWQMEGEGKEYVDKAGMIQAHPEIIEWEKQHLKPGKPFLKVYRNRKKDN